MDEKTRTESEAAAFRRLVAHLRQRTDVQNIDLTDFPKDALTLELESFAAAVIDNTPPLVDGEAGLRALKVALDIMQHIKKQPRTHI